MADFSGRPVWAEVSLKAIARNLAEIRRVVGSRVAIMAVVKANAYGHGLKMVARTLADAGADWLAVATPEEAFELCELDLKPPLLILGHTPKEAMVEAVSKGVRLTLYSPSQLKDLAAAARQAGRPAKVHVEVDTGMGRLGFLPGPAGVEQILAASRQPEVQVEGIFTHFACADEADKTYTLEQQCRFEKVLGELRRAGVCFRYRHAANSAAVIDLPQTYYDMVRPGLALYGLYPSPQVRKDRLNLEPAMSLKARIIFLKEVPAGTPISYGRTYVTDRRSFIATLPLGYADGYSRLLSNRGVVLVRGRRAPVVGRVCMDHVMIDVTDIPEVAEGDEVVLFGRQGEGFLPVEDLAEKMGTISYEVLCLVGERVPRVYV